MSYSNYVIYYSNIDSSQQINLTKLEVKLNEIENDFVFVDINSAIEFSEIKRYIDNNIYPKSWTDYDIKYYKEKINKIEHNFNTFLSKIESDNFIEIYSNIKFFYLEQFWRLIANRGIYKKIQRADKLRLFRRGDYGGLLPRLFCDPLFCRARAFDGHLKRRVLYSPSRCAGASVDCGRAGRILHQ